MALKNKETKGQNILNLNLALKVCKVKADLLKLHAHFKRWQSQEGWYPKHYTDGLDLTFELIEKFAKNHKGYVKLQSGVVMYPKVEHAMLVTVSINNHAITFDCKIKDTSERLALAMLQCIEDERRINARKD